MQSVRQQEFQRLVPQQQEFQRLEPQQQEPQQQEPQQQEPQQQELGLGPQLLAWPEPELAWLKQPLQRLRRQDAAGR